MNELVYDILKINHRESKLRKSGERRGKNGRGWETIEES